MREDASESEHFQVDTPVGSVKASGKIRTSEILTSIFGAVIFAVLVGVWQKIDAHETVTTRHATDLVSAIDRMAAEQRVANRYACEQVCILAVSQERRESGAIQCRQACAVQAGQR